MRNKRPAWQRLAPVVLVAAALAAAYALDVQRYLSLSYLADRHAALTAMVEANLPLAALLFALAYALATAILFPGSAFLTVAGGLLFGWPIGGSLAVLGATLGATVLFVVTRSAFGDLVRHRADGVIRRFADEFRRDAFTYLLVLRLTPVVPFTALNIAPACLGIPLRTFVAATLIGIVPGAMVYAYLGAGIGETIGLARGADLSVRDLVTAEMTLALAGLGALSILGLVLKKWLSRRTKPGEPKAHPDG